MSPIVLSLGGDKEHDLGCHRTEKQNGYNESPWESIYYFIRYLEIESEEESKQAYYIASICLEDPFVENLWEGFSTRKPVKQVCHLRY